MSSTSRRAEASAWADGSVPTSRTEAAELRAEGLQAGVAAGSRGRGAAELGQDRSDVPAISGERRLKGVEVPDDGLSARAERLQFGFPPIDIGGHRSGGDRGWIGQDGEGFGDVSWRGYFPFKGRRVEPADSQLERVSPAPTAPPRDRSLQGRRVPTNRAHSASDEQRRCGPSLTAAASCARAASGAPTSSTASARATY